MNGTEPKIEIFKPFGEAIDLTKKILFQPFDLGKWCVIGFAAFLAHLGGGFNFNFNLNRRSRLRDVPGAQPVIDAINAVPLWILVIGIIAAIVLVFAILVLFAWLRARGRFIFIDCVVRNRGAIVEPWREFRRQGNSYFLFAVFVGCCFCLFAALLSLPFILPIVRGVTFLHFHDVYLLSMIVLWSAAMFLLAMAWAIVAHIMVVVMYRQRCLASQALHTALSLITNHPGEITLYCLFWIVLVLGSVVVACISMCVTCCLTVIPYVGTVILLPVFVCLRAFGLLFLRQFGSEYDVWASVPPPDAPSIPPPPATA